jgi:predicted nucleic acid-binding protein
MTAVVSDTSPINYLCLIGEVDVLPQIFGTVLIPPAVVEELRDSRAPSLVSAWAARLPDWAEVRRPVEILSILGLDPGETEAISLALELPNPAIVIDERRGRLAAKKCGVSTVGTLNILEVAHDRVLINFEDAVARLRKTSFHINDEIVDALLAKIRDHV